MIRMIRMLEAIMMIMGSHLAGGVDEQIALFRVELGGCDHLRDPGLLQDYYKITTS